MEKRPSRKEGKKKIPSFYNKYNKVFLILEHLFSSKTILKSGSGLAVANYSKYTLQSVSVNRGNTNTKS